MGAAPESTPLPPSPRRRRGLLLAATGVALLVALAAGLHWLSRPEQVAGLIMDQVGTALGLEITSSGASEYRLRGTPHLLVHDVAVRQPGAQSVLLTADRVYLSLPWSTLRARGRELAVKRMEVDAPRLDLAALQTWLATRPPGEGMRVPTLTDGLQLRRGEVAGDGWSLDRLQVELASLHPDTPVATRVGGRFRIGDISAPFDLQVALTRPEPGAGLGIAGIATPLHPDWRMPMELRLSGRLPQSGSTFELDAFRLGMHATWQGSSRSIAFGAGIAGPLGYRGGTLTIAPLGLALRPPRPTGTESMVPTLTAHGALAWGDALALRLEGALAQWPAAWPALPSPLPQSDAAMPFGLDYRGPADASGVIALTLRRDDTVFDGRFRLPEMLAWLGQFDRGHPLPPLQGKLSAPRVEFAGAVLEGLEVEIVADDDVADDGADR